MAKYLVTQEPGFPGPYGIVRPGGVVTLPDDAVPSRFFEPVDQAAQTAIAKARKAYVERVEARRKKRNLPPLEPFEKEELLAVPPLVKPPAAVPVEDEEEGLTLSELGKQTDPAVGDPAGKGKSPRAADR